MLGQNQSRPEPCQDIELIQETIFDLLSDFDAMCAEVGVPYSLAGGTALGAVRRGSLLPWDDEADVLLLRDDFDKFVDYYKTHPLPKPYLALDADGLNPWPRLLDTRIVMRHATSVAFTNLMIDILPLDELPSDPSLLEELLRDLSLHVKMRLAINHRALTGDGRLKKVLSLASPPLRATRIFRLNNRELNRIASRYANCGGGNVSEIIVAAKVNGITNKESFSHPLRIRACGREFSLMPDYDSYLHSHYEDYAAIPPEDHPEKFLFWLPKELISALQARIDTELSNGIPASDYVVDFLANQGVTHFFGYQGTMIARLVESIERNPHAINHVCRNEQAAAFAATAYAKLTGEIAVAYATSGPGAANLISGMADAYFDQAPVIFITGQLNERENQHEPGLRQQGFQEMNVVASTKPISKYASYIPSARQLPAALAEAVQVAKSGRPGPMVLDIPMDVQAQKISAHVELLSISNKMGNEQEAANKIAEQLCNAKRPLLILGNGFAKDDGSRKAIGRVLEKLGVPFASSMLARDLSALAPELYLGHVGSAYGSRAVNIAVQEKADLIVSLGCRLCSRQIGQNPSSFAQNAKLIRVDLDKNELERQVHPKELDFFADCNDVLSLLGELDCGEHEEWLETCHKLGTICDSFEAKQPGREPHAFLERLSQYVDGPAVFCCDVGQHQIWAAQSLELKHEQRFIMSGGHGAMGFGLPAAIGACATDKGRVFCITGDGGLQMNIQELQVLAAEQLPITVIVMDNRSLGLITQQQDDFFEGFHAGATAEYGYDTPDFAAVAQAYGIDACHAPTPDEFEDALKAADPTTPHLVVIDLPEGTQALPKTYFGETMQNQRPYLDVETKAQIDLL